MRKMVLTSVCAALAFAVAAAPAHAQPATGARGDRAARREWLKEHKGQLQAKWQTLPPEQQAAWKAYAKSYGDERKTIAAQVKSGTLDKKSAGAQLKTWRESHRPKQG